MYGGAGGCVVVRYGSVQKSDDSLIKTTHGLQLTKRLTPGRQVRMRKRSNVRIRYRQGVKKRI